MKKAFLPVGFFLVLLSCGNTKKSSQSPSGNSTLPSCVQEQLIRIENKQYDNPPIQIDEYEYQGKRVFLFTADCCDQYNIVFDENCKGICAPSGGITGKGDGKCKDFQQQAKHVRVIWKKA